MTSNDELEIVELLNTIKNITAGTNYIHESIDADDPSRYSRPWFSWANSLYGEMIL